jgi:hypothetical protein
MQDFDEDEDKNDGDNGKKTCMYQNQSKGATLSINFESRM